jgi:hypothetical protein
MLADRRGGLGHLRKSALICVNAIISVIPSAFLQVHEEAETCEMGP